MNNKWKYFLLAMLLGSGYILSAPEVGASNDLSEYELAFVELINQARANPRAAIEAAGMDPDTVSENKPLLRLLMETGLNAYAIHPRLNLAAGIHVNDMFRYNHYGRVLPDNLSPSEKVLEQGYPAIEVGISLGNVVFQNFIAPEDALWKIFKFMLTEELNSENKNNLVLLNPNFNEIGISLIPGEMVFGGQSKNVYLAACFTGYSFGEKVSSLLLEKINAFRNRPAHELMETDSNLRAMPPLAEDFRLLSAGLDHAFHMEKNLYYDQVSPEGESPADRVQRFGYDALLVSNALAIVELQDNWSAGDYASKLFEQLVFQEFQSPTGPEHILNREFTEVGLAVDIITFETSPDIHTSILLLSFHLAKPALSRMFAVGGAYAVAEDDSGNQYWKGIQGLKVELVELAGESVVQTTITGPTGLFQLPIISGMYKINMVYDNTAIASKHVIMAQESTHANFWLRETPFYE